MLFRMHVIRHTTMNGEEQLLVTDEPVEFEKSPIEAQDFKIITDHFRGVCRIFLLMKVRKPKRSPHVTRWS